MTGTDATRIVITLDDASRAPRAPVTGHVALGADPTGRPFLGWLELISAIECLRSTSPLEGDSHA